jgi:hypothetical protein
MYHAMAYASVLFLQAGFSMDQVHARTCTCDLIVYTSLLKLGSKIDFFLVQDMIEKASEALNASIALCAA